MGLQEVGMYCGTRDAGSAGVASEIARIVGEEVERIGVKVGEDNPFG